MTSTRSDMEWGRYTQIIGDMVDNGVEELALFSMGEPFACDWLPEAIAFAKGRGMRRVLVTTDGSLATPEKVITCFEAGLDSLHFHINGRPGRAALANLDAARRLRDEGAFPCQVTT